MATKPKIDINSLERFWTDNFDYIENLFRLFDDDFERITAVIIKKYEPLSDDELDEFMFQLEILYGLILGEQEGKLKRSLCPTTKVYQWSNPNTED